jgi:hypothetical protein
MTAHRVLKHRAGVFSADPEGTGQTDCGSSGRNKKPKGGASRLTFLSAWKQGVGVSGGISQLAACGLSRKTALSHSTYWAKVSGRSTKTISSASPETTVRLGLYR